jgi:hypothetical protein
MMSFIQLAQQASTQGSTNDAIEKILYGGDQNLASQIILSLSQTLNSMSAAAEQNAGSGKKKSTFSFLILIFLIENLPSEDLFVSGLLTATSVC